MNKQRSINIPDDVWTQVRVQSVMQGQSSSTYVTNILTEHLGMTPGDMSLTPVTANTAGQPLNPLREGLDRVTKPNEWIRPVAERH